MKNYSHLLNPNHATIIFKCKYPTEFGQILRIVGNIEELGSWEPSKSLIMTTNDVNYPIWESTQEITGPVGMEIHYKYVVYDKNKNTYIWENLKDNANRKHIITSSGIFVVNDEKNSCNSFIQKLMEPSNENNFPVDFERSDELNFLNRDSTGSLNYNKSLIKSLSYDSNQFNGNDLNETFFFCLKVSLFKIII
jgi:hypothetical protein